MPIVELEQEDITQFTSIVTPMFQTIGENKKQNTKLAELRDSLLPRLMSGKLDVSNIAI
jgi:type I restriction enzyme S subunit